MKMTGLKGRDFISLGDFSPEELNVFIETALSLKRDYIVGNRKEILKGKTLAMLFESPSLRTRTSFETGMTQLGGHAIFISTENIWGESPKDTAAVLSRYADGIMARVSTQQKMEDLAKYATVPVINGLTDMYHPCQALADIMTVREKKGKLKDIKMVYMWAYCHRARPAGVVHSLLLGCSKTGIDLTVACPEGYEPLKRVVSRAEVEANRLGGRIEVTNNLKEAIEDADVVYAKNYRPPTLGEEEERALREKNKDWILTNELMKMAKSDAIFMHCMAVYREEEVTSEVVDGPQSVIYDQAENRLHAQKAILALLL